VIGIIQVDNEKIQNNDLDIAEIFNDYFANISKILPIVKWASPLNTINIEINDPVQVIISKYANQPSIIKIKSRGGFNVRQLRQAA